MKSKRVLTILLSLAIMVTFMPTMVFAGNKINDNPEAHDWDEVNVTYLKDKDCSGGYYVSQQKCLGNEEYGLECAATKTVIDDVAWSDHTFHTKFMSVPDALKIAAENPIVGGSDFSIPMFENTIRWFADNNYCRVEVGVCDDCGLVNIYLQPNGTRYATKKYNGTSYVNVGSDFVRKHSDVPYGCVSKYTCEFCHQDVAVNPTKAHEPDLDKRIVQEKVCGENTSVVIDTCKDCGAVYVSARTGNFTDHKGLGSAVTPKDDADKANYVQVGDKFYEAKTVVTEATCTSKGVNALVCSECGMQLGTVETPMTDHHYETLTTEATCTKPKTTTTWCTNCDKIETITYGQPVGHKYVKTVYTEPTCFENGLTVIECTECGAYRVAGVDAKIDTVGKTGEEEYYFTGFGGEAAARGELYDATSTTPYAKCIKVDSWAQKQHDLGDYEHALDPTCEMGEVLARKCAVDGAFYAHDAKVVGKALGHDILKIEHAATCGEWGYIEETCQRCKEYQKKTYTDKPVVAEGAECNFEWKVVTPATDTKDGVKALVCTVCGAVKAGSETVIPADLATAEKKAAVEAAANILDNADVYTAKSVAAVQEAKDMLNSAIASGTAADVKAMTEKLQKAVDGAKLKDANTMTASGKTITASKNKTKTFKKSKAFSVKNAKGKVTFAKKSGKAKIVVSKTGKVTVKSGLKKGTYPVKVAVTAAGNDNYLAKTKVVTLKVKVK
jgi:hypothetical protein